MTNKADQWAERLTSQRRSGQSIAAYCREHTFPYAQFIYWQRRLSSPSKGLVPVKL